MISESNASSMPPQPLAAPLADPGNQLLHILDAMRGLTTHRQVEDALVHSDGRYREFLEALGVAVYTTDADGRITFFNEAAVGFWGRRPELGEEWCGSLRLYHADRRPMRHDECPMAIALKENRAVRGWMAIAERPDGTFVSFVPYPTPLRDPDGRLVGAVNVLVDVTEQKQAEQALRDAADALQASNAVKDEFLGLVSHELRTPVTTIFGNARLLVERADRLSTDDRRAMLEDVALDSERLLSVIENLLLLTRLGSGTQLELEPQILARVVRDAVGSFARRHTDRPIRFDGEERRIIVDADATYLEMVMENLLGNADKYSPAGYEIEVAVRIVGDEAQVTVLDRGIGLTETDTARLFTRFYRAEAAKVRANGIGIGLAVCRRVIEIQGGRVWARPRDGGGSEIGFALPIARAVPDGHENEGNQTEGADQPA